MDLSTSSEASKSSLDDLTVIGNTSPPAGQSPFHNTATSPTAASTITHTPSTAAGALAANPSNRDTIPQHPSHSTPSNPAAAEGLGAADGASHLTHSGGGRPDDVQSLPHEYESTRATLGSMLGSGPSVASVGSDGTAAGNGGPMMALESPVIMEGMFWNYFSIGADAQAAFGFHHLREKAPGCTANRIQNQCWYSYFSCTSGMMLRARLLGCLLVCVDRTTPCCIQAGTVTTQSVWLHLYIRL